MRRRSRGFLSISKGPDMTITIIIGIFSLACIIPFILVFSASFTDEMSLLKNGYQMIPSKFSFAAYEYIFKIGRQIVRSFGVSVFITVAGTIFSVTMMAFYAYALSSPMFKFSKFFNFMAFITMLFSGGLVPTYLVVNKVVGIRDTLLALILLPAMNVFFIIVMRTFFKTSVPQSIIEAARIDGASELKIFISVVLPISLPSIATIALFTTLGYWNDWYTALLYIDSPQNTPLQYMLKKIDQTMEFLLQNSTQLGATSSDVVASLPQETVKMAVVVVSTLPIACAYPFFQKYFVKGLTVGAVKG